MMAGAAASVFSDPLLRATVGDALREAAPNAALTAGSADAAALQDGHWALASTMGWVAAMMPEQDGGLGLGLPELADICEEMGHHLFCGPFAETAALLPALAAELGGEFHGLLPAIASGAVRVAVAEVEAELFAMPPPWSIAPVEHAAGATHVVVLAAAAGGELDVGLVEATASPLSLLQPMDPTTSVARMELGAHAQRRLYRLDAAAARKVLTPMHVAIAAELLGIGEAALSRTVEHVANRRQFGQAIGAFQAVKHRLADAYIMLAGARLAIGHAARNAHDPHAALQARVLAAQASQRATSDAIQFHGGSGFSWELDLHLYLKRARRLGARNGGTRHLHALAGDDFIAAVLARASV